AQLRAKNAFSWIGELSVLIIARDRIRCSPSIFNLRCERVRNATPWKKSPAGPAARYLWLTVGFKRTRLGCHGAGHAISHSVDRVRGPSTSRRQTESSASYRAVCNLGDGIGIEHRGSTVSSRRMSAACRSSLALNGTGLQHDPHHSRSVE